MVNMLVAVSPHSVRLVGGALRFFAPAAGGVTRVATKRAVLATLPYLTPHGAAAVTAVVGVAMTAAAAYELYRLGRWGLS